MQKLPRWLSGKECTCQHRRWGSNPWVDSVEEDMETHSSILAWKIPWTEQPAGCSPWGCKELDKIEQLNMHACVKVLHVLPMYSKWVIIPLFTLWGMQLILQRLASNILLPRFKSWVSQFLNPLVDNDYINFYMITLLRLGIFLGNNWESCKGVMYIFFLSLLPNNS